MVSLSSLTFSPFGTLGGDMLLGIIWASGRLAQQINHSKQQDVDKREEGGRELQERA